MSNLPQEISDDERKIIEALEEIIRDRPPSIGVVGVSGTGKSTTLNEMFGTSFYVSSTIRGTVELETKDVSLRTLRGPVGSRDVLLRVVDAPGLGESIGKDPEYLAMYRDLLDSCDAVLWIMTARNRAVALDQQYLLELREFWDKISFGINQSDLVDPIDWNSDLNIPSSEMERNLSIIESDRSEKLFEIMGRKPVVVAYSALHHYRLVELFDNLTENVPDDRRWLFEAIRHTSVEKWLDQAEGLSDDQKSMFGYNNRDG